MDVCAVLVLIVVRRSACRRTTHPLRDDRLSQGAHNPFGIIIIIVTVVVVVVDLAEMTKCGCQDVKSSHQILKHTQTELRQC